MSITPGQQPDLSFYYNSAWSEAYYYSKGPEDKAYNAVAKSPITADSTQPKENAIGFLTAVRYITDGLLNADNKAFLIQNWTIYLPEGSISFSPNSSYLENEKFGYFAFYPNETLIYRIVSGTKDFFACNGYVAIVTDPAPGTGRNCYVYLSK